MYKDIFLTIFLCLFVAASAEEDIYKKLAIYQTNSTVDAFSAYKDDEVQLAIGTQVQGKYVVRIFQLIESDQKLQIKQIFEPIQAENIFMRFLDQGQYLLIAIDNHEIQIFKQTDQKSKTDKYQLIQTIKLQQEIKAINVCQKHDIFAISIDKTVKFYTQEKGQFIVTAEYSFNEDITGISISPNKNWVSASSGKAAFILEMSDKNILTYFSTIYIEDNFTIDFIIAIDQTHEIFALHQAKQKNGEGSIRIFGQNTTISHQFIQKEHFDNFTDFPRSMSVSENGKMLAFYTNHNLIWVYQRNEGTKMKCTYCLRQSFTASKNNLNHLWTTSGGQFLLMTDNTGQITVYKNMEKQEKSSNLLIIIIIVVACIIGLAIYYYNKKKAASQQEIEDKKYFELKETPKF